MTETQAKSGAPGASTEAEPPPVKTSADTDKGAQESSTGVSAGAGESPNKASKPDAAKPDAGPAVRSDGHSGTSEKPAQASGDAAASAPSVSASPAASATPAPVSPAAKPPAGAKVEPAGQGAGTVNKPVSMYPGGSGAASASSVVPGAALSAPVIARASVSAPFTTVTGTGLRQSSGATSAVGTAGRPTGAGAVGAARVSDAVRTARATVAGATTRGPRRARLHLKRIDPWSVMKFSFAVSLVLFVVAIVATSVLYLALDAMGVFNSLNKAFSEVTGTAGGEVGSFKITAKGVIGTSVLLGAVNMVLFTALMTLAAFVYNVCADLVGGVELTLSEKE